MTLWTWSHPLVLPIPDYYRREFRSVDIITDPSPANCIIGQHNGCNNQPNFEPNHTWCSTTQAFPQARYAYHAARESSMAKCQDVSWVSLYFHNVWTTTPCTKECRYQSDQFVVCCLSFKSFSYFANQLDTIPDTVQADHCPIELFNSPELSGILQYRLELMVGRKTCYDDLKLTHLSSVMVPDWL